MKRIVGYLGDNALAVVALIASLLALAGGSYAAFSINGSEIRNRTIDPLKFNPRLINGSTRAWAVVSPSGRLIAGAGEPRVSTVGSPGQYEIDWGVAASRHCATSATVDDIGSSPTETVNGSSFVAGAVSAGTFGLFNHRLRRRTGRTVVETFTSTGAPTRLGFDVIVDC